MPYIIAVLVLVVVSVGFTLTKTTEDAHVTTTETVTPVSSENLTNRNKLQTTEGTTTDTVAAEVTPSENVPAQKPESEPLPKEVVNTEPATKPEPAVVAVPTPEPEIVATTPPPNLPIYDFLDGTYQSSISYRVPEGKYSMDVAITITNDIVTAVNTTFNSRAEHDSYTRRFVKSYESSVIGKDIETLNLSRVGGASLTTKAFNDALDTIRTDASV